MMKKIDTLAIIGVGLIGGSIARGAKKQKLANHIIGFGRRRSSLNKALRSNTINEATLSFAKAVRTADLVVIATPVGLIPAFLKECQRYCKDGCIITDVGSTKLDITRHAEKILGKNKFFVGSHPMAGSEKKGFEFSRAGLFDNSTCFLTRTKKTNKSALKKIEFFWKGLGAKPIIISPHRHDKIVAEISHLPHAIAVSLVNCASSSIKFAGSGFKDTTRVASSDANIWMDIFFSNKINIVKSIAKFTKSLARIRRQIENKNKNELRKTLVKTKTVRDKLTDR